MVCYVKDFIYDKLDIYLIVVRVGVDFVMIFEFEYVNSIVK